jgi:uncharacterized protein YcbK (DUF882 family)
VSNRASFLVILVASLSALVATRALASSTPPSAKPLVEGEAGEVTPDSETDLVAVVRTIVARIIAEANAAEAVAMVPVDLFDVNGEESAHFELPLDGKMDKAEAMAVARFFHCRRSGRVKPLHPGVIAMLAEVGKRYPGRVIEVVSGFRASREERKTSPHLAGRAIDLRVRGVKTGDVRDWLWSTHSQVGIGFYPHGDYLHMDTRPGKKDTAWTQPVYNGGNDYHPRWARKARAATVAAR